MKILLFASIGLFVLACCLPALEFKDSKGTTDVMLGLRAFVVGWSGLFAGVMSWYANPFLALGLALGFMRKPLFAASAGVIAIAIALTVLSLVGRDLPADEGNVNRTTVVRLLPGCYVWISSMVVLPLSALFSRQP